MTRCAAPGSAVLLQHILPSVDLPQVRGMLRLAAHAQVNYVGKAANLYQDAGYQLSGSAYVVNKHLGTTWLWDRVRVSGGAYGGFSDFDTHSGMFSYLSYRDPNLTKTVRVHCMPAPAARPLYLFFKQSALQAAAAVLQCLPKDHSTHKACSYRA